MRIRHHLQRKTTLDHPRVIGGIEEENAYDAMEAYLICHLAAVLPICYLAYACNGDLTCSTGKQRRLMRMASREAYAMLKAQGIPILPEGDDQYYAYLMEDEL